MAKIFGKIKKKPKEQKQEECTATQTDDAIEIHRGKTVFILPKASIEPLVQWLVKGEEEYFSDDYIEATIDAKEGIVKLKDQLFIPMSFSTLDIGWFLDLIGVQLEAEDDTLEEEASEQEEDKADIAETRKLLTEDALVDQQQKEQEEEYQSYAAPDRILKAQINTVVYKAITCPYCQNEVEVVEDNE